MTTIFFYVLLFQIKDWDKICEEEGKMTSPIICYLNSNRQCNSVEFIVS